MSLLARHLEENAIPTVLIGSARDIVEHCGARYSANSRSAARAASHRCPGARSPGQRRGAAGGDWKGKIFTQEQPFLEGEDEELWMRPKALCRKLKAEAKA